MVLIFDSTLQIDLSSKNEVRINSRNALNGTFKQAESQISSLKNGNNIGFSHVVIHT